jgi:hypothetical protein
MQNKCIRDVAPCEIIIKLRFGEHVVSKLSASYLLTLFFARVISFTLKMEATYSSETLVYN